MPALTAKSLKATLVLNAAEVATLPTPAGQSKSIVQIAVGDRLVTADLNTKSLRRVVTAIKESGADAVAVVLSGKLEADDTLTDAGIAATPRVPKAAAPAAA
jgi:hypothetical protein